jgi:hypothetical protein
MPINTAYPSSPPTEPKGFTIMSDFLLNAAVKASIAKDRTANKVQSALASERGDLIAWILVAVITVGLISLVFIKFIIPVITAQAQQTSQCIASATKTVCKNFS